MKRFPGIRYLIYPAIFTLTPFFIMYGLSSKLPSEIFGILYLCFFSSGILASSILIPYCLIPGAPGCTQYLNSSATSDIERSIVLIASIIFYVLAGIAIANFHNHIDAKKKATT